jgi:hypothetical protein
MQSETVTLLQPPVCSPQIHPFEFFQLLKWIDGRPLFDLIDPYRRQIFEDALFTFRSDGSPKYRRALTGRAKKNAKTLDCVLTAFYKLLVWKPAGSKGNQIFFLASDLGQADDDLDLCKKLARCNDVIADRIVIKSNILERRDGEGFIEILPAQDVAGMHGKTYLTALFDEAHTMKDYRVLEGLEIDRTRSDSMQWFASYASLYRQAGVPLVDMQKQHAAGSDPRLYVSWFAGTIEEANPSLNAPLGPTLDDIEDARRSLPSWIFRRLYENLPGQPDGAAFDAGMIEQCIMTDRVRLLPDPRQRYQAFCDMSGGGADDSALAIAHTGPSGQAIIDRLTDQGPRLGKTFSTERAVEKFAGVLKEYQCNRVEGDRYAGTWPEEAFKRIGMAIGFPITYVVSQKNRSQLYSQLEPLLNSGQVELLNDPKLYAQLIGLVRTGEKIDHPSGEHDDHANAVAGAALLAKAPANMPRIRLL